MRPRSRGGPIKRPGDRPRPPVLRPSKGSTFEAKVALSRVTRWTPRTAQGTRPQATTTSPNDAPESLVTLSPKGPVFETKVTPSHVSTQTEQSRDQVTEYDLLSFDQRRALPSRLRSFSPARLGGYHGRRKGRDHRPRPPVPTAYPTRDHGDRRHRRDPFSRSRSPSP